MYLIFQIISVTDGSGISCELVLRWISLELTGDKSTLVQVMAWCRQATSHYLSQCWPRFMSPYGVTRPQWAKIPWTSNPAWHGDGGQTDYNSIPGTSFTWKALNLKHGWVIISASNCCGTITLPCPPMPSFTLGMDETLCTASVAHREP